MKNRSGFDLVRKLPKKSSQGGNYAKEHCIERFLSWWSEPETIKEILKVSIPQVDNALKLIDIDDISNSRKLAELFYNLIGEHFLYEIHGDMNKEKTCQLRKKILDVCVEKKEFTKAEILHAAEESHWQLRGKQFNELHYSNAKKWLQELATFTQLPPSVSEPPQENTEDFKEKEIIEANLEYKPLYDYQYTAGLKIKQILETDPEEKRMLLSIPTGSGKTRLMVEALIDWLDYGKKDSPPQQKNSKFIIWIAQSHELCEQAIDAFKSLYKIRGRTALTIHRFFGSGGSPPPTDLSQLMDENGVIVATIHSFNKLIPKNENSNSDDIDEEGIIDIEFEDDNPLLELAKLTSCIVIDEAHRATSKMYTRFLAGMGFNFRKKEPNSKNIALFGLTATPFRGTGVDFEGDKSQLTKQTITLRNRFGGEPFYPEIYADISQKKHEPVPIIDCPKISHVNESTRISANRSFDNEGVITKYVWQITYLPTATELYKVEEPLPNPKSEKIIDYIFPKEGEYKIQLTIINNEGIESSETEYIDIIIPDTSDVNQEIDKQKLLYRRLIKRKILCDVFHEKITLPETVLDRDESRVYVEKGEYQKQTLDERGKNYDRNKLILEIIKKLRVNERKKILVFACNIEHARLLSTVLKAKYGINAEYLDSKVNVGRRIEIIEKFKENNDDINVLCNVDILTTGFDAPNIDCVFVTRPAKSTVLYTQMIGRGMRGTKGGGTSDMWLVDIDDNFQLHYDFDNEAKLGWKVFEDEWRTLSELNVELVESELQETDKQIEDNVIEHETITAISEETQYDRWKKEREQNKLEKSVIEEEIKEQIPEEQMNEPLKWSCIECGITAIGVPEIQQFFGIEGDPKLLIKHISEKSFQNLPSKCHDCRLKKPVEPHPPKDVKCPYVEFMKSQKNIQGNYQMVFGLFLIENQLQGQDTFDIDEARLYLQKYNPGKNISDIPQTHPVFDVYRKRDLISEFFRFGVIPFKEILQPELFKELCVKKIEEYEEKQLQESKPETDSFENKEKLELAKQLDIHYKNMKQQLGHVPTTRQFRELTPDKLTQTLMEIYHPKNEQDIINKVLNEDLSNIVQNKISEDNFPVSYQILLESNDDDPSGDQKLRDNLYDEYFELFSSVQREITRDELDEYGNYTLEDYDEVFVDKEGNYEEIYKRFRDIIQVMGSVEKNLSDNELQIMIKKINDDYNGLKETLGHSPHFEELRDKSNLGIEYLLNFYGSLGRFKRISDRAENEQHTILHLKEEYHNIKKLLKMQPLFTQMLKHCREGFRIIEIFKSYSKYLEWLGEPEISDETIDEKFKNERKSELIQLTLKRIEDTGREKAIELLLSDKQIPYNEWFGSKSSFIEVLDKEKYDPWIKSTFEKIKQHQKPEPINQKMKIIQHEQIPKFKEQLKGIKKIIAHKKSEKFDKCPKCNAKLENLGHAIVCTSKYCTYYKSG